MGSKAQIHYLIRAKADTNAKTNFGTWLKLRDLACAQFAIFYFKTLFCEKTVHR